MDENQENQAQEQNQTNQETNQNQNDLKQETVKTFNEAKEQMKNINLKQEAEAGKGLLKKLWKNPLEAIKEIAEDEENKTFKTALLLVIIWAAIALISQVIYYLTSKYATFNFLTTLKVTVAPALTVIAMTLAVFILNKKSKKSISRTLTSVTIAYVPSIISSLLWLLNYISSRMSYILSPVGGLLRVVSIILMYYTVKALTQENDEVESLKLFVKVQAVFYIIDFVISFLGISI